MDFTVPCRAGSCKKCHYNVLRCTDWMVMMFICLAKMIKIQDIIRLYRRRVTMVEMSYLRRVNIHLFCGLWWGFKPNLSCMHYG